MTTPRSGFLCGSLALSFLLVSGTVSAAELFGRLAAHGNTTITSEGLDVRLTAGQDYVVFSGDTITTDRHEAGIRIPGVGLVGIDAGSIVTALVEDGRFRLVVEQGRVAYDIEAASGFEVIAGENLIAPGADSGVVAVEPDAAPRHTAGLPDGFADTGPVFSGLGSTAWPTYAQVGASPPGQEGTGQEGPPGLGLFGGNPYAASFVGLLGLTTVIAASDSRPASPVAP